jgi:hypothetical protein
MTATKEPYDRRRFLQHALTAGAGAALAGPFSALGTRTASAAAGAVTSKPHGGYGPLFPTRDQTTGLELLLLPKGFEYISFGWTNDVMSDGVPTPGAHDGMGAFTDGQLVRLVRNHERGNGTPFVPGHVYDPTAAGGTTTLVFDPRRGALVEHYGSLSGTIRNCAGGITPAGTWLTCEETTQTSANGMPHGYVFEVPAKGGATAVALKAMGRFSHEATATDPSTGYVYETEDTGTSALYRFRPVDPVNLAAGGVLEAMTLEGTVDTAAWNTGMSAAAGWVTIEEPDPAPGRPTPWQQASARGAARIVRGEGAWYGKKVIYIISTSGGPASQGQVFAYDLASSTFTCVFASPAAEVLNAPDNVTVSPRGGLVLCEDGSGTEFLHGLTRRGEIFKLAQNNAVLPAAEMARRRYTGSGDYRGSEWAGAVFDPKHGEWLFANLQSPGVTFAITGPWNKGPL